MSLLIGALCDRVRFLCNIKLQIATLATMIDEILSLRDVRCITGTVQFYQ